METDAKKWLESLSRMKPNFDRFSSVSFSGINVLSADHGRVVCSFCIPSCLTDAEGYWQPGAIATLMDIAGVVAIMSIEDTNTMKVTVDLAISFFSQAKLHEEVEIEAHTVEQKGKLTMVVVHIRKKASQQLVAVGRQWMTFSSTRPFQSKL